MALLSTKGKAPGVYIQEITIPGPLAPASTSNLAIVGPASSGPLNTPTPLTNIDQFWTVFGDYIEAPYRVYAAHAINGFFNEGGSFCYFVRVGNGAPASVKLNDRATTPQTALVVTALQEGNPAVATTAQVQDASLASTTIQKATANVTALSATLATTPTNKTITVTNAADLANFVLGDPVHLHDAGKDDDAVIAGINSTTSTVTFQSALTNSYTAGTMVYADPAKKSIPVSATTGFIPGDSVHIDDGTHTDDAVIASIKGLRMLFVSPIVNTYTGGTVRTADIAAGATQIRVAASSKIEPGTVISFTISGTLKETAVVRLVNPLTNVLGLTDPLGFAYNLATASPAVNIATMEFKLTIVSPNAGTETFDFLSMDSRHSRYFDNIVQSKAVTVALPDPPSTTPAPNNIPAVTTAPTQKPLAGGADDNLATLGTNAYHAGIDSLRKISDVNLLSVPDAVGSHFTSADTQDIQAYMIQHCQRMQDRFAILDCIDFNSSDVTFTTVTNQRAGLNSDGGFAALYCPWIGISNPFGSGKIYVPPSGHTAGVYANNDNTIGVYKAPANEAITSALSLEVTITDDEQGPLNDLGINVIRSFPNDGIKIWGARTIAPPDVTAWRFINVRRLLLFIEKTIQQGTRFAVFEPNNLALWQQIKRLVNDFLNEQWQGGALFGDTPALAYRVRVDETLNPPAVRALGILVVEVTVVPTTPAEFIIFQVVQDITGTTLQEQTS
jgi:phage tail sheath protein FI